MTDFIPISPSLSCLVQWRPWEILEICTPKRSTPVTVGESGFWSIPPQDLVLSAIAPKNESYFSWTMGICLFVLLAQRPACSSMYPDFHLRHHKLSFKLCIRSQTRCIFKQQHFISFILFPHLVSRCWW